MSVHWDFDEIENRGTAKSSPRRSTVLLIGKTFSCYTSADTIWQQNQIPHYIYTKIYHFRTWKGKLAEVPPHTSIKELEILENIVLVHAHQNSLE